ncbi:Integrase core domain-containing protein [Actinomyces ruminicola]|uniref:Integrase core domain-containing protein n=2 Tax=Actinomyces ruminicola TaxID=332524 RepID=A0A1H0ABU2_9ACTO|nr:Integrase core domain-containing protein [Actinomyces ruminicola]
MRDLGLRAALPRAKVRTTFPADDLDDGPDLVRRDFTADAPGAKWARGTRPNSVGGSPTYIRTWAGFVYLATVLDCCTTKVFGYAPVDHMRTEVVCEATGMAARNYKPTRRVTVFHSDRDHQYTSQAFADHLKSYGTRPSVGPTGVCWDKHVGGVSGRDAQE